LPDDADDLLELLEDFVLLATTSIAGTELADEYEL
jgi:hypothetical protein